MTFLVSRKTLWEHRDFRRLRLMGSLMLCGLMLSGLMLSLGCFFAASAQEPELIMQEITFTTQDDVTLSGSWIVADGSDTASTKSPAVILVHDYGLDRRDWGIFIPDLVEQGLRVLAIDLRGHGQSIAAGIRQGGDYSFSTSSSFLSTGLLDIEGAVRWLKKRGDVNAKAISLVGVGAGGDLAYIAARQLGRRQIRSAVVISPSLSALTEGDFIADSPARAVLFCVSSGDSSGSSMMAAETLSNFTDSPKKVLVYTSNAHGLSMFYKHPEIALEILAWLSQS